MSYLHFVDYFFLSFHTSLIAFNLVGWIFTQTRKTTLYTLICTGLSWFALGLFRGIGYCPITDWHCDVLHKLGQWNLPESYIQYLLLRLFKCEIGLKTADTLALCFYFAALSLSVIANCSSHKKTASLF